MVKPIRRDNAKYGKEVTFEHDFPDDFVLTIDTREQSPLFLKKPPIGLLITRDTLTIGDYSIKGFESEISIERKTVEDIYGCCFDERFKREIETLSTFKRRWLVIEAHEQELLRWQQYSSIHPNSMRHVLKEIETRYYVPIHYEPDRNSLERWILDQFLVYFKCKREGKL
jgi:ERCC4-type nuclease